MHTPFRIFREGVFLIYRRTLDCDYNSIINDFSNFKKEQVWVAERDIALNLENIFCFFFCIVWSQFGFFNNFLHLIS
jgi:hypothetical protein